MMDQPTREMIDSIKDFVKTNDVILDSVWPFKVSGGDGCWLDTSRGDKLRPFADGTKDTKLAFEKLESGRAVGKVVVEM
jgi:hypothetical protein